MTTQHAPAHSRDGLRIQQIADRFEVYNTNGEFFGTYLVRTAAEKRVALLAQRAGHPVLGSR
ncbi:hypothetical protein [Streptomyces sp. SID161]|uniref:hypothetical protein n=1 Tax=Streptomyces sp. SID161 TaxID=2690251 RepID=UPI00136CAF11|nr:hypothetical protein [Streptomyces sp. SID161]MYW43689.1 hypothetical protein [Streptomyces sp. SID161]